MAKYKKGNFLQIDRNVFDESYKTLSGSACKLYFWLCNLEHRFTNKNAHSFFRTNEQLSNETGLNVSTIKRAKKELIEKKYIETGYFHFEIEGMDRLSKKKVTRYTILNRTNDKS